MAMINDRTVQKPIMRTFASQGTLPELSRTKSKTVLIQDSLNVKSSPPDQTKLDKVAPLIGKPPPLKLHQNQKQNPPIQQN